MDKVACIWKAETTNNSDGLEREKKKRNMRHKERGAWTELCDVKLINHESNQEKEKRFRKFMHGSKKGQEN